MSHGGKHDSIVGLRHCATSQKVVDSIHDVMGFFKWSKLSSRNIVRRSTKSHNINEYQETALGAEGVQANNLWNDFLENMEVSTSHNPRSIHCLLHEEILCVTWISDQIMFIMKEVYNFVLRPFSDTNVSIDIVYSWRRDGHKESM